MKFYNFPIKYEGNTFFFNRLLGVLLSSKEYKEKTKKGTPELVKTNYQYVINPYLLDTHNNFIEYKNVPFVAKIYAKLIVFISKHSFFVASLLTKIPFIKFTDSKQAIAIFTKVYPSPDQHQTLCLPRTLFVIATSKSFKKNGTAFIGVFLPSRKMHAWVIESRYNPDPLDTFWILYQPVIAIAK